MRTITRNPNPPACLAQRPQGKDWYTFMGTPCHQQVGDSLREEQHHVCCYCEVEITEGDCHIEHMAPRSVRPGHDYDYANLSASCDGGAVEHCGRYKDDRHHNPGYRYDPALFCLPHDPGTMALFQYLPNGSVTPATELSEQDAQKAGYMIGYLGLQCARLTGRRRAHARQLIDMLGTNPYPALIQWAIDYYLNPDHQNRLRQFSSLSKKILNQ
jgi:uncharacterized protein (TIGR02646 family)